MARRCKSCDDCRFYHLISCCDDKSVERYKLLYCEGPLEFRCVRKRYDSSESSARLPDELSPTGGMLRLL